MVGRNSFVRGLEWQGNGGGVPMGKTLHPSVPETVPVATCCNSTPFYSQRWPRLEAKSYDHPIQISCSMATETFLGQRVSCRALVVLVGMCKPRAGRVLLGSSGEAGHCLWHVSPCRTRSFF